MIPKRIHYIWIGDREMTPEVKSTIESWKKKLPEYHFFKWDESNLNFDSAPQYVKDALGQKKWAFVTDYFRLEILFNLGGIYLDTDVEILRDFAPLLKYDSFIGIESKSAYCTAVIGSEPRKPWLDALLKDYKRRKFIIEDNKFDLTPNSEYIFSYFLSHEALRKTVTILEKEYFSPLYYYSDKPEISANTYTIHWYSGSWRNEKLRRRDQVLRFGTKIFGESFVPVFKAILHIS